MEYTLMSLLVCSSLIFPAALIVLVSWKWSRNGKRQPPGPPGWPIVGNIFQLGSNPHQTFYKLRPKYGPLLWLKLGSVNTLVVQTAKAATELFKNHDNNFCDRKCPIALTSHNYNQASLAIHQYGVYWRVLRRLYSTELLANKRINETAHLRRKCVDMTLQHIEKDVAAAQDRGESGEINLTYFLFLLNFNVVGNLTLSRDLLDSLSTDGQEFWVALDKVVQWAAKPNLADFLPFLKIFDPQGIKTNMDRDLGRAMAIIARFVKERVESRKLIGKNTENRDLLDGVLEYEGDGKEGPDRFSYENMIIIILEMFITGTDTTSSSVEWAMTEMFRNPEVMRKAKEELDQVVGRNRNVEETDINQLPYLKAVVKETLRLHPPAPLLVPRNTLQDTEFMGYLIPKDTQVLVNVWAIGRDPECWEDPLSFKPERFIGSNIDFKGQNFGFIPFGSGRRICVAIALADQMMHLTLASLLHRFDWELSQNSTPETIDMNERAGAAMRKLMPLKVIPKKRFM